MFDKPILLITFNRPEHTRRVLASILEQNPKDLYVFQDGPRAEYEQDTCLCAKTREVISHMVSNTDTILHTLYSETNLGCGAGPATGISWFFSDVDAGIVMEDDCLPHPDFFGYCAELLDRYSADDRVMYISSTLYNEKWKCEGSYDFSHYMITGAWASWARAWNGFDFDLHKLDAKSLRRKCRKNVFSVVEANWWYFKALEIQRDNAKKSYWDFQMQIHLFDNNGITIHPRHNLVSNIGFDAAGTHTLDNADGIGNKESFPILPLAHPDKVQVDTERDYLCFSKVLSDGYLKDGLNYIYKLMLFDTGFFHQLLMKYKRIKNG